MAYSDTAALLLSVSVAQQVCTIINYNAMHSYFYISVHVLLAVESGLRGWGEGKGCLIEINHL